MSSKFRQRCLLWLVFVVLGLSISLFSNTYGISPATATVTTVGVTNIKDATELEKQGRHYYSIAKYDRAVDFWQQAYKIYTQSEDILGQARVLSNLSLAYSHNDWEQATHSITKSLELIDRSNLSPGEKVPVLAQIFNNQGILALNQGNTEQAIAFWERAKVNYQLVADDLGVIRASINQASAFKELGLYRRAVNTLAKVEESLAQQPDSLIKATGLRSYGDILRLVGQVKRSQEVLQHSLEVVSSLNNSHEEVKTLIALGNTYKISDFDRALKIYDRGLETCDRDSSCLASDLPLQVNLAKINLLLDTDRWQDSQKLTTPIQKDFARLPNSRANIDRKVNFASALVKLNRKHLAKKGNKSDDSSLSTVDEFITQTITQAKAIDYKKAQSYGWGLRGQIKEELKDLDLAQKYTQQALVLGQKLNAPEIVYLWQWQSGRIDRALGERATAISHYYRAVELLKSLSQDLVAIDPDVQYSFREGVEPVYRELVSLLLSSDLGTEISQANLEGGREVIESLQLAELNNFFREACLDAQTVDIDRIDPEAAVIYPIILGDRLEVILSLPNQPLQHYAADIDKYKLEATIEQFRHSIVVRSRRNFYPPAKQLYDLLIRPALPNLTQNKIKTLVFVPDGSLRNIPLGALYDGQQYLIENYSIALTPGLQLLAPRPIEQVKLNTIAVGLTQGRQGFSALNYVDSELNKISKTVNTTVLVDREFTSQALQQEIKYSDHPIVHIATHGQFGSSMEDTFLVAWDDKLNINQLDNILQTRNLNQEDAIELLVLSACETATGDRRAALGMAGMAVRAGARSTLATLWSVNDLATTKLMSDFYHELSDKHLTKADAVRQAQISLLHSRGYEHPFYWAAYVLLGNWL